MTPIAHIATIELKLTTLEPRIVGDGVAVGTFSFQSLEDVCSWCEAHLPTKHFGLFLNGVSVFEFLAKVHTDTSEFLTNLYNCRRINFPTFIIQKICPPAIFFPIYVSQIGFR
jgi:hypothetical protein